MRSHQAIWLAQLMTIICLLSVTFALPPNAFLSELETNTTITASPEAQGVLIPGQGNLYVEAKFIEPLTALAPAALPTLRSLRSYIVSSIPAYGYLDKVRYRFGAHVQASITPTTVGPGPMQKKDESWGITNKAASDALGVVENLLIRSATQMRGRLFSIEFYVFEKDYHGQPSRGVVAEGLLSSDPRNLREDKGAGDIVVEQ